MKKIILVENRKDRLERLLDVNSIKKELKNKLYNFDGLEIIDRHGEFNSEQWDEYFLKFEKENLDDFMDYDIFFIHKSKISREGHKNLDQFCRKHGKSIIYFSGGLTGITFINDGYPCLSINSSIFYSSRLIDFLEKNKNTTTNILEVAYGQKWQLSNLLKLKNMLHQYMFSSGLNIELETEIEDLTPIIDDTFNVTLTEYFQSEKIIEVNEILNNLITQKTIAL
jgi:hypothetical protein